MPLAVRPSASAPAASSCRVQAAAMVGSARRHARCSAVHLVRVGVGVGVRVRARARVRVATAPF